MADTRVKIVDIQVRYKDAVDGMAKYRSTIAEVKKYQQDLKKELAEGKVTQEEYDRALSASEVYLRQQNDALQTLARQVSNQVKAHKEQEGSLKSLRTQLAQTKNEYESLGKAEREGAEGKAMQEKIAALNAEISKATKSQQLQEGSIRKLRAELAQAKADYEGLSKAEREGAKGKELETKISNLNKEIKETTNTVKVQEGSLVDLRQKLSDLTKQYDSLGRAERESAKGHELKDKINAITTELKTAEEETQRFYRNVGNYKSATEGLENIRMKIADIGKSMLMALGGGSLLAFSKSVLQVSRDFQDGMARVRAVTNATAEDMQLMTDEARKMGRETIYHATDAAKAMENLARGGFDASEATTALSRTLQLAQANAISLDESSDLLIRTMRGFALPISEEEMLHANDVLSKTAASSATNVIELGEALKNAAPFGHALNQSIEETNAALGVLADVGVRGADAGTALRMVILGLSSPTAKQQKVFKEYGIEISQTSLETEGLTKTLQRLKDSGIMQASNSAELMANVFGRRCTPQVMALVGNIDRLGEKLGQLQDSQGTTERMFEQSYSKISVALFSLSSAWESFMIQLGNSNSDALVDPITALTEGVRFMEQHLPELGNLLMTVIASVSFAKLIQGAQTAFVTIRESAIANAEAASTQVRTLQQQEVALRKTVAAQTVAVEEASGTERTMIEAKLLANKRQLAETEKALVKAKTEEITLWERAAAVNSGNAWKSAMAAASIAVTGFVTAAKTALKSFAFTAVIMLAFEALQKLFSLMGDSNSWFGKMTSAVTGFIKDGLNWLITQFNKVSAWFKGFANESKPIQVFLVVAKTEIAAFINTFKVLGTVVKSVFSEIFSIFKNFAKTAAGVGEIINGIINFDADTIVKGAKRVGNALTGLVTDFAKNVGNIVKGVGEGIADTVVTGIEAAKEAGRTKAFGGSGDTNAAGGGASVGGAVGQTVKPQSTNEAVEEQQTTKDMMNRKPYQEAAKEALDDWNAAKEKYQQLIKDQNATTEEVLAARRDMQEAQKSYEELTGDKQSKGSSGGGGRGDSAVKRQAELERKAFEEAEKAMLDLMKDTASKRRQQIEQQYDSEIRKLKVRLATEKNLTEEAKEAIRRTILLKEQKKREELDKLSDEELKRQIQDDQKLIESRLSILKKGSEEELRLKQEKNVQQAMLDQLALEKEKEDRVADAKEKIRIAQELYGQESVELQMSKENLIQIEADYSERSLNIEESRRQRNLELEQQYQQQLASLRQQAWQNHIMELEIADQEYLMKRMEDGELYLTQEEGIQMLGLDVVTQGQMDILQAKVDAAQQAYDDVVAIGQLETETVEQFEARKLAAEKNHADAKVALRKAELKNEQAYLKSSQSITNSLISLTAAIGESDEEFAKLSKLLTLVQIGIDTGKALSGGIASAAALPYPANLAAIATTVATVLTNIATAISTVKSANFAQGGKVTGPGTGTSDSIAANLSNGEFVMTAKATRLFEPLLVAMNEVGAGVIPLQVNNAYRDFNMPTEELTESFKEAAEGIRPVVSVVEIAERERSVEIIENLDNI